MPLLILPSFVRSSVAGPAFRVCGGLLLVGLFLLLLLLAPAARAADSSAATAPAPTPAVAFFYGEAPPWEALQAFDIAVIEPDHVPETETETLPALAQTRIAAYVSLGEVQPSRSYARDLPAAWLKGKNRAWGSHIIDQSVPEWPAFFVERIVTPLWNKGYRSFFLDTLDSYQQIARTPEQRAAQEAGMIAAIGLLKQRYPAAQLIFNRGFEILDRTHDQAAMVVAESLFEGFDATSGRYRAVPEQDRQWLQGQLQRVREEYRLPVVVIDYVPAAQRERARDTAKKILAEGYIPWVATGDLATLGVGSIEVMPRKVLLIHGPLANEFALRQSDVVRLASMPLNYLGYATEYADPAHLPTQPLAGRYAGVVVWMDDITETKDATVLASWLKRRVEEGVPFSLVGRINPLLETPLAATLGFERSALMPAPAAVEIVTRDAMIGFEYQPLPQPFIFYPLSVRSAKPLLTLAMGQARQTAAAVTPWGGYVLTPYASVTLANEGDIRWVIDPFAFFRASLRLPEMPVPDVTTESGRRLLMVHMDGDGFVSRTELPGNPYAGEVVRDRVVRKYPVPMTISVIEAELSPQGLYPKLSPQLEPVARDIFRAANVEIASHSYSHPFNWRKAGMAGEDGEGEGGYNLAIPGYRFDLQREIEGSIRYIENRLAPPGKKVRMFLWTGDCIPGREALEWTQKLGVLNMNGGDTTTTRSHRTMTEVEGLGVARQGLFQVFAPNQNENVYTHDWTGPFYGFERLLETFELTESPRRLKPMNIYFHTYITTKRAGMQSLDKVFNYALKQESTPVFASEYARKVLDFRQVAVARTATGWRVRGMDQLHTLRLPATLGVPDLLHSTGIAGWRARAPQGEVAPYRYLHVASPTGAAELQLQQPAPESLATLNLVSANGRILDSQYRKTADGIEARWTLAAHVPLEFTLAQEAGCRVRLAGRFLIPVRRDGALFHYRLTDHAAQSLEAFCQR